MISARSNPLASRFRTARSSGYVGIDIGVSAIKVAQVERHGQSWRLVSARALAHREPLTFDNPRLCAAQITESLDRLWESSGRWFADDAACVLPLSAMTYRSFTLPHASPAQHRAMIGEELADDTGIDSDRWSFSFWHDTSGDAEAGSDSLSTIGVTQELADQVLEALLSRGLACNLIAGQPFVLARAVAMNSAKATTEPTAVIDWGYESALLTVVSHGQPVYTRVLRDCGFRHVIEAVGGALNLDPRDVPRLICLSNRSTDGAPEEARLQPTLHDLVESSLRRLKEEVQRTVSFLQLQRSSIVPGQFVFCGGGATLRGINQLVGDALQAPTSRWSGLGSSPLVVGRCPPACLLAPAIVLSAMRWEP